MPPVVARLAIIVGRVLMGGFALFWLSGVGAMLLFVGRQFHRELRKAYAYKPVLARVTKYTPPAEDAEDTPARFEYRYAVAGKTYRGKHSVPEQVPRTNEYESPIPRTPAVGTRITAYYDPDDPAESTLVPIAQPFFLGFFIFLSPFAAVGMVMLYTAVFGNPREFLVRRGPTGRPTVAGGGPYVLAYFILSAVTAFAFFGACFAMHWERALYLGLALWVVVVPLLTWRIGGFFARRAERRQARPAEPATGASGPPHLGPGRRPRPKSPARAMAKLLAVTVFWCGMTGVFAALIIGAILKQLDARRRFAKAPGVVVSSRVKYHPATSDSGATYEPIVKYRYAVAGRDYVSTRYAYSFGSTGEQKHARAIVRRHPKGAKITVYYDPKDPASSVLDRRVTGLHWFLLLFLQPFLLVGLFLIGYTITHPARLRAVRRFLEGTMQVPCAIPTWGVLRHEMGGFAIRARRRPLAVLGAAVVAYGVTCFLGIFAAGFFLDGLADADARLVGAIFAVAAGMGVLAAALALVRRPSKARLHVDPVLGRLSLTSRQRDVQLTLAQVGSWTVGQIPNPHRVKSEDESPYAPLLAVCTTAGQVLPIHVFNASEDGQAIAQKAAEGFAELTGKPVTAEAPADAAPDEAGGGPTGPLDSLCAAARQGKEYADLT